MGVEVNGLGDMFEDLDELEDDYSGPVEEWVVGTPVEYAPIVEYGSSRHTITPDDADVLRFEIDGDVIYTDEVQHPGTDPQPFFRPAVNEVQLQGTDGFIRHNTRKDPTQIESTREFLRTLSLALERRIKELAPVDTGNLRASVGAVPISDIGDLE